MINKTILVGNLGADPEIRYTASGKAVANARVATSEKYKNASGDLVTHTEWHRLVGWGKTAEIMGQYATKGRQVYIEGKNRTRTWDDEDGVKHYTTEVIVNVFRLLGPATDKNDTNEGDAPSDDEYPAESV